MSTTGLDVFDKSLQLTNIWLNEIMEEHGPDRQRAWHILSAVLRHHQGPFAARVAFVPKPGSSP